MTIRTSSAARALCDALQQDAVFARRLVEVAHALTGALVDADADRVEQLQAVSDTVAGRQQANDRRRTDAAAALARELGVPTPPSRSAPTLTELMRAMPRGEASRILDLRERILGLHLELSSVNERNRALIENLRECTRVTVEAIVDAATRPLTYGKSAPTASPTLFVDRAA